MVPDPTNSQKGRCEGASQSADETVRQNVPQFQHDALMESNTLTPPTPSDTEKDLSIRNRRMDADGDSQEAPMTPGKAPPGKPA